MRPDPIEIPTGGRTTGFRRKIDPSVGCSMVECAMRHRQPPEACQPRDCEPQILLPTHAHDALHVWALRICTAGQQAWWVIWGCGGGAPNNKGLAHRTTSVGVAGAKIETHGVYSPGRVCVPGVAVALTLDTPAPTPCKTTSCSTICCTTFCAG